MVEFQQEDRNAVTIGEVVNMTYTLTELQLFTNYMFRVAGVNDEGTGPFTEAMTARTDEGSRFSNISAITGLTVIICRTRCCH